MLRLQDDMTSFIVSNIMEISEDDSEELDWTSSDSDESKIFSCSESSSSDCSVLSNPPRRMLHRITTFMDTIKEYDDQEFKEHFRLNRSTIDIIINEIEIGHVLPQHKFGRKKICTRKAVLMTVWYLCNTETFQQCSDRFNVTKSTCHRIITKIIEFLVRKSGQYIVWPTDQQLQKIKSEFYKMHGINGVVGAIDGSHIKIKRPASKHHYVYYNRKGDYSLLIQGVCDYNKKFISFFCGEPGSIHDSRLLKKSSLYRKGIDGFLGLNFLLGDSAYPCLDWLICPFKDNGNLTENQKIFNYRHSATRIVIENAFGLLKGRFRRLKYFENDNLKFVVKCIVAAAVLHNICLDNQDDDEFDVDVNDNNDENMTDAAGISDINEKNSRRDEIFATMFI